MRYSTIKQNQNALVLIPCCKQKLQVKEVTAFRGQSQALPGVQQMRDQLLQLIQNTPSLATRVENRRGILNPDAPLTQAIDLYQGKFYKVAGSCLRDIRNGQYPSIHVLIVSAFYGIAKLEEGLKEYELRMGDKLCKGLKVYQFWQQAGLWRILQNYINQNDIVWVWSLLPNSSQFLYHCVFNDLWRQLRGERKCFHVQVPGAGSGTGYKRAEWLVEILRTNPNQLIGNPFPPTRLVNYTF